jgi:hypothetical protein
VCNSANDINFIFDIKDYTYVSNTIKLQAFYNLGVWKSLDFELIVQPQYQVLEHPLYNRFFVLPNKQHFEEKITEFTRLKTMYLYALELGFVIKKELLKKLDFLATIGLGVASIISNRTKRLAKGFTFFETVSLTYHTTLHPKPFYM